MKTLHLFILVSLLLCLSCKTNKPITYMTQKSEKNELQYADGNGNLYKINDNKMQYIPIKMEESSSGMYSGGNEKEVNLNDNEVEEIEKLLDKAINDTQNHTENRTKGTGVIQKINNQKEIIIILKHNTAIQNEIEILLKKFLKQN